MEIYKDLKSAKNQQFEKLLNSQLSKNKFNEIIDGVLKEIPQAVSLKLPKLKKVGGNKPKEPAKIKLPKLKKVT